MQSESQQSQLSQNNFFEEFGNHHITELILNMANTCFFLGRFEIIRVRSEGCRVRDELMVLGLGVDVYASLLDA